MSDDRYKLKVKIKSLAAEAKIIRQEELKRAGRLSRWYDNRYQDLLGQAIIDRKTGKAQKFDWQFERELRKQTYAISPTWKHENNVEREELYSHRLSLAQYTRAALIAYAFIRGKEFSKVEQNPLAIHVLRRDMFLLKEEVERLARKYGQHRSHDETKKALENWFAASMPQAVLQSAVPVGAIDDIPF